MWMQVQVGGRWLSQSKRRQGNWNGKKGMVMRFDSESVILELRYWGFFGCFSGVWDMNEGELGVLTMVHLQCWDRGGVRGFRLSA